MPVVVLDGVLERRHRQHEEQGQQRRGDAVGDGDGADALEAANEQEVDLVVF